MSNSVPKIDVVDIFEDVLCDVPIETLASLVYRKHLPFHGAFV